MQAGLKPNPRLVLQNENARIPGSTPLKFATDTDTFAYMAQVFEAGGKRDRRIQAVNSHHRISDWCARIQHEVGEVLQLFSIRALARGRLSMLCTDDCHDPNTALLELLSNFDWNYVATARGNHER